VYLAVFGILTAAWYVDRTSLSGRLRESQAALECAEDDNAVLRAKLPERPSEAQ
jgi:hypothetical protein